ncbi:hypothetical protein, partial [Streptococcus pneumoniae]|uniref:hypothetical protein n=1 Tax=Streptococcus pneumoniae TaxID=1313 RepID=UPI0039B6FD13
MTVCLQGLRSVSCGDSHALALHNNGFVMSWGAGAAGRLGHRGGPSGREIGRGDRDTPTTVD